MPTSASYAELQTSLRASWPQFTLRSVGDVERTFVVLHSHEGLGAALDETVQDRLETRAETLAARAGLG